MALFGEQKLKFLRRFLPFENGTPSHDQLGLIFGALDAQAFQTCFIAWTQASSGAIAGVVAIDGKTVRRSFDRAGNKGAIHLVSAWSSRQKLVLGARAVDEKSNEITAIPELLDLLAIKGAIVTIDAMGCQKKIAEKIIAKSADYVFGLRAIRQPCGPTWKTCSQSKWRAISKMSPSRARSAPMPGMAASKPARSSPSAISPG